MPRTSDILSAAFWVAAAAATYEGYDTAKHNPVGAGAIIDRCFSIPRDVTTVPKQFFSCAHVPGIWIGQALAYGRRP